MAATITKVHQMTNYLAGIQREMNKINHRAHTIACMTRDNDIEISPEMRADISKWADEIKAICNEIGF